MQRKCPCDGNHSAVRNNAANHLIGSSDSQPGGSIRCLSDHLRARRVVELDILVVRRGRVRSTNSIFRNNELPAQPLRFQKAQLRTSVARPLPR